MIITWDQPNSLKKYQVSQSVFSKMAIFRESIKPTTIHDRCQLAIVGNEACILIVCSIMCSLQLHWLIILVNTQNADMSNEKIIVYKNENSQKRRFFTACYCWCQIS